LRERERERGEEEEWDAEGWSAVDNAEEPFLPDRKVFFWSWLCSGVTSYLSVSRDSDSSTRKPH
jgi:hypothetical protein